MIILNLLVAIILGYTAFGTACLFYFAVTGRTGEIKCTNSINSAMYQQIVVLISTYKEDCVILESAQLSLLQNYQSSMYDVVVSADSLKAATVETLRKLPVNVIEVTIEKPTRATKIVQILLPSRMLLLCCLVVSTLLSGALQNHYFFMASSLQLILVLLTLYISTPVSLIRQLALAELLKLQFYLTSFLKPTYKMQTAKNQFLHTLHRSKQVNQ
ncbi:hypothetical protein [Spirosoma flavum]|uniref:Uncharacterized protein n=1 Tax=Spirosoma flavum TaxID=2048557 RepID=A0ABW6AH36_9BACT